MKTTTGVCRYCGQIMTVDVPESFTQEDIDKEVERKCSCPEAQAVTKIEENIANTEHAIMEFFKDKEGLEPLEKLLLNAVQPLAENKISKITIAKGGYTGTMKPSKEGVKISLKYTTEDCVES